MYWGIKQAAYHMITPNQDYAQIDTEDMWQAYCKCLRLLFNGKKLGSRQGKRN